MSQERSETSTTSVRRACPWGWIAVILGVGVVVAVLLVQRCPKPVPAGQPGETTSSGTVANPAPDGAKK